MEVRAFISGKADAQRVIELDAMTFGGIKKTPHEVSALAMRAGNTIFLALEGEETLGFISLMEAETLHGLGLWIDLMAVAPAHQNRGVAKALIGRALEHAAEISAEYTSALVRVNNPSSIKALERMGYVKEPTDFNLLLREMPITLD